MQRAGRTKSRAGTGPPSIVALGSAMSTFAIVRSHAGIFSPTAQDVPLAVSQFNGSHFTMIKMMEGSKKARSEIKITNRGHKPQASALCVRAGHRSRREPAGARAIRSRKMGCRILIESRSHPQRGGGRRGFRGPTLASCSAPRAHADETINKQPEEYAHLRGRGRRRPRPFRSAAVAHPSMRRPHPTRAPVSTKIPVDARLGPGAAGATYENTVDNRLAVCHLGR